MEVYWGLEIQGMSFSLPRFLRNVLAEMLRTYFDERSLPDLSKLISKTSPNQLVAALRSAIEGLPEQIRCQVYDDFERASKLVDEIGQLALRGAISSAPDRFA